jgi:uncharacterized protein (TIGR02246 family)
MVRTGKLVAATALGLGVAVAAWMAAGKIPGPQARGQEKTASGQPAGKQEDRAADRAVLAEAMKGFVRAMESGDAKALANHWTAGGEYIADDGTAVRGRTALAKAYANFFAKNPKLKLEIDRDSLRFLSRDSAVEEGHFQVRKDPAEAPVHARYSALHVREDGKWLLALLREWPAEGASLRDLGWLIGSWEAKRDGLEVRTVYEWDENKVFIKVHFTIKEGDRTLTGMEMIGKDPATGQIRSWIFGGHGGVGDVVWERDGQKWVQQAEGVQPNGSKHRATNVLTRLGNDAFTWQSIQRTEDDEELPDLPPIKVTRVKQK